MYCIYAVIHTQILALRIIAIHNIITLTINEIGRKVDTMIRIRANIRSFIKTNYVY